jgi:hypothetical protein
MNERQIKDFDKPTQNIIHLLKIHGTQTIQGTGADKLMDYISDIDLQEYINCKDDTKVYKGILKIFQDKYKDAEKDKNIFITDFKCGVLQGGFPIRWNRDNIKKGFQYIEDKKYNFVDCLKQTSIIKMDVIALINGKFTEFSENYYFNFGRHKTFNDMSKYDVNVSLLRNYKKYLKDKPFKAIKRLYSYQKLNNKVDKKIIRFLNSTNGKLNKLAGDIEVVMNIIDFNPDKKTIIKNLGFIRDELPEPFKSKLTEIINKKNEPLKESLGKLVNEIQEHLRPKILKFIEKIKM